MKNKFDPKLLNEELKRFKLISEYSFYNEEPDKANPKDKLLLGYNLEEQGETPEGDDALADELGVTPEAGEPAPEGEAPNMGAAPEAAPDMGATPAPAPEAAPEAAPVPMEEPIEPESDEEEIDVTALVNSGEDAKHSADRASRNSKILLKKISDLESRLDSMSRINIKLDDLEREIVQRNPTNVEKLEMQSLHSYPYSQKLTDYWADKEGAYDVMGDKNKKNEFVLTKDDVDSDYSDNDIKQSFVVKNDDFEEEEID